MEFTDTLAEIRSALDAMFVFHRLRYARDTGRSLSAHERRLLHLIRDAFEPLHVDGRQTSRRAIRLPVTLSATIASRHRLIGARAVVLTLRSVEVVAAEPLTVGARANVSVASVDGRRWYAFHGRVARCSLSGRHATIALLPGPAGDAREARADALE